jgi:hypothetical protein
VSIGDSGVPPSLETQSAANGAAWEHTRARGERSLAMPHRVIKAVDGRVKFVLLYSGLFRVNQHHQSAFMFAGSFEEKTLGRGYWGVLCVF